MILLVILNIIHRFSHDRIDNEIYYSDLSYKLITKRKKENRNTYMIIISLLSCKNEFYASFIVLHMF